MKVSSKLSGDFPPHYPMVVPSFHDHPHSCPQRNSSANLLMTNISLVQLPQSKSPLVRYFIILKSLLSSVSLEIPLCAPSVGSIIKRRPEGPSTDTPLSRKALSLSFYLWYFRQMKSNVLLVFSHIQTSGTPPPCVSILEL